MRFYKFAYFLLRHFVFSAQKYSYSIRFYMLHNPIWYVNAKFLPFKYYEIEHWKMELLYIKEGLQPPTWTAVQFSSVLRLWSVNLR